MVSCSVCGWAAESFEPLFDLGNVCCPSCGSYERHRALLYYLQHNDILAGSGTALEIGSGLIRATRLYFERIAWAYFSVDCWGAAGSVDVCGEASMLPFKDSCFDVVVCIHVLEHVDDDFSALSEIRRITKPCGLAMIQIPCDDTVFATREHELPSGNRARTGCHYHHKRDYGLDFHERLGFFFRNVVEVNPMLVIPDVVARNHGFDKNYGTTFFCSGENSSRTRTTYPGQLNRDLSATKRLWLTQLTAYNKYLANNGNGSTLENWLQAEAEIMQMSDAEILSWNVYDIIGFPFVGN